MFRVYKINCRECSQKYSRETGMTDNIGIKEHQRLSRTTNAESLEIAEYIALAGHTIASFSAERLASYEENTRKRKIREAVDILIQRNLMNRRLEEGRVSDDLIYCPGRLGDSVGTAKRRLLDKGHLLLSLLAFRVKALSERESFSMNISVKLIDSWSRGIRRRLLVEPTLESLHQTLSLEMEVSSTIMK
ncbi:unnamed protein product [Protopolystoma xenopodis]|uniref:Uncharacterized protein n=1 Tax=Protopolystoma xenopodis TaxID=117903 RepID=A0A3S5CSF9_9PLAT|nr:unnamed protein product [Protopolystoma xenopodis]